MAALSTAAHGAEAVGNEWPMCKGRNYKIEKWMAYLPEQLSTESARESMERLSKAKRNPLEPIGDHNGSDDLERLQGYVLRVKAEYTYRHPEHMNSNRPDIKKFCNWITTHGEDD